MNESYIILNDQEEVVQIVHLSIKYEAMRLGEEAFYKKYGELLSRYEVAQIFDTIYWSDKEL